MELLSCTVVSLIIFLVPCSFRHDTSVTPLAFLALALRLASYLCNFVLTHSCPYYPCCCDLPAAAAAAAVEHNNLAYAAPHVDMQHLAVPFPHGRELDVSSTACQAQVSFIHGVASGARRALTCKPILQHILVLHLPTVDQSNSPLTRMD
jgi:hypothetical protein